MASTQQESSVHGRAREAGAGPQAGASADTVAGAGPEAGAGAGESVVISGMSGVYANAQHVGELKNILYDKINPVTSNESRWTLDHPEIAPFTGKAPDLQLFDAQFFKVHYKLANNMDVMGRKILEQAHMAIYDAGLSPEHLSGKKIGVYIGSCASESERVIFYTMKYYEKTGFGLLGCSKSMIANRISYWLNAKGPSISVTQSCCGSAVAVEMAHRAILRGDCEAAIVGGASMCLHPHSLVHTGRIMKLSPDNKTRSFDANADGCVKSEALNVLFLQKAKDALRIYAEIVHVKSHFTNVYEDETGAKFGLYRNPEIVANFLREFYEEAKILPQTVEYVEACGSAEPEADKSELEVLAKVFCNDRNDPLQVGSVISNIGYTDDASGIAGITKILLAYHTGELAGNLHYETPRHDVAAISDGRIHVVSDHTPFGRGYTAVNGRSITGVNSHILLKGHYKPKNLSRYKSLIPHLVLLSGRQESDVHKILTYLKYSPLDPEELALLNNIHGTTISGYLGRGFAVLGTNTENQTVCLQERVDYFDYGKRPLWFVYSGMGSQYAGMGEDLMRIPVFSAAIERCDRALKPKGIDIVHIITSKDKTVFDNILNSFVGIAAIQIGLTDILKELGLVPDKIIGHSVGELGCAYADGCFTAEEMILSAYNRGLVSVETPFIRGAMAAVGLGYQKILPMCPPEIEVACHNSPDSCTISGPEDVMRKFLDDLVYQNIFAKEVPCSNIAYHSRYIADAGPNLLKYLREVIKSPKARSERWLSTSVPMDKWADPASKYSSAEYHTNNLLNPVLFEETSRLIPSNAILVEVAPHGLLQAILKRALPSTCINIPLTRRGHHDNVTFFLESIGRLYIEGFNPNIQALYPRIEFPVSTETPMLSHLVEWVHNEKWTVPLCLSACRLAAAATNNVISIHEDVHSYLQGHVIGGKILYPSTATLVAAWDTLAMTCGVARKQLAVEFGDVMLHTQPVLHERRQLRLGVSLQRGTGRFEVMDDMNSKVASGFITLKADTNLTDEILEGQNLEISSKEIYNRFYSEGFCYKDYFKSIQSANSSLTKARVLWNENWVTFIDGMIQLNNLRHAQNNACSHPKFIKKLIIDPNEHNKCSENVLTATFLETHNRTICGGVLIENLQFHDSSGYSTLPPNLKLVPQDVSGEKCGVLKPKIKDMKHNELLRMALAGQLKSLHWEQKAPPLAPGVTVKVHYAGLNVLDAKRATGVVPCENSAGGYGMDFSGLTDSGIRVMGLVQSGAVSSHVHAHKELLWPVPTSWSLEDAATVPLAYCLAYYCLVVKHKLCSGMRVLVHGGAGALGQAVISLALANGCEVFTTVSNIKKKQFLLKLFPSLEAEKIGYSRDLTFCDLVLNATNGIGVDVVISNVKGEAKNVSFKCVAHMGTIIDVNQIPDREKFEYGMYNMTKSRSYIAINFSSIFNEESTMKMLQVLVSDGIARGSVRPLSRVTYAPADMARAFRLLAGSNQRGRVLLNMHQADLNERLSEQPRLECSSDKLQIVVSDDEVFGLALADLLVSRGARRLQLILPASPEDFKLRIRQWTNNGVQLSCDRKTQDVSQLINNNPVSSIEGIYIIVTSANRSAFNAATFIEKVDLMSRKKLPDLKYFVVINTVNSIGQKTCLSRSQAKLQGTIVTLEEFEGISAREAMSVVEQATVLTARVTREPHNTFVEQLATVAGVNITQETEDTTTLSDLGMDKEKARDVRVFLHKTHNLFLATDEIQHLTVERIKEIDETLTKAEFDDEKGLKNLFTHVEADELVATTPMIFLPTRTSSATVVDCEFDMFEPYITIVPGVEGNYARFRTLCERLKLPALVLQPDLDRPRESVTSVARRYAKVLSQKFNKKKKFYLVGYESGVFVVLEMAAILEENGFTGVVYCIGSPDDIQAEIRAHLIGLDTDDALQDAILRHMFTKIAGRNDTEDLEDALQDASTWQDKLDVTVRILIRRVSHSAQYARQLIVAAYERISELLRYDIQVRALRSRVVLLLPAYAATQQTQQLQQTLQRYSCEPVACHGLRAPLSQATDDLRCAGFINHHLDADILASYEQRNLCETYLLSSEPVMTW